MKYRIGFVGVAIFLALVGIVKAGDISGKWIAVFNVDIELNIVVDGTMLKGTVNNPLHGETKIRDGKIDKNTISFLEVHQEGLNELRILWKGTYNGEVIRFSVVDNNQRAAQIVAIRPKAVVPVQTTK
jgi:hypothetical protein